MHKNKHCELEMKVNSKAFKKMKNPEKPNHNQPSKSFRVKSSKSFKLKSFSCQASSRPQAHRKLSTQQTLWQTSPIPFDARNSSFLKNNSCNSSHFTINRSAFKSLRLVESWPLANEIPIIVPESTVSWCIKQ